MMQSGIFLVLFHTDLSDLPVLSTSVCFIPITFILIPWPKILFLFRFTFRILIGFIKLSAVSSVI